jgi:hypothetical protein
MSENGGLDTYLKDHLAGATTGTDMARHLASAHEGSPLGKLLAHLADEIEEDRRTLEAVMDRVGTAPSPLKQAGGWLAEKMSRIKLGPLATGPGDFLAIETLSLGVEGKACLWRALKEVAARHPRLSEDFDFDHLIERAERQRSELERERLTLAAGALT